VAWFDAVLTDAAACHGVSATLRARAVADRAVLAASSGDTGGVTSAGDALATAREADDATLLARALTACAALHGFSFDLAQPYFDEAISLARAQGDRWTLVQILSWKAVAASIAGDPSTVREAAGEGRDVADAIGDRYHWHACGWALGMAHQLQGEWIPAAAQLSAVIAETEATHDQLWKFNCLNGLTHVMARRGEHAQAQAAIREAQDIAPGLGGFYPAMAHAAVALLNLAVGDIRAAVDAADTAAPLLRLHPETGNIHLYILAEVALARGDVASATRLAEEAVSVTKGAHQYLALVTHARVAIAQAGSEQADSDARAALACAVDIGAPLIVPEALEILGVVAGDAANHCEAARLFGAADALRQRTGLIRYQVHQEDYQRSVAVLRNVMEEDLFQTSWSEGFSTSAEEAIAYAQRGHGRRRRPTSGWSSLTATEHDVIRLVSDGLANKDVATRLFISPRTVQTHLTHIYAKLGLTSRVQLVQEAARRTPLAE
jgi:DNA-binding CsgD family transcriptional regulator